MIKFCLTLLLLLIIFITPTTASAAILSLTPKTATVNKGCSFVVNIELDTEGAKTDGVDVILNYDRSKITTSLDKIVNGSIFTEYLGNSVDTSKINITGLATVSQPYSGKGTFASITFTVPPDAQPSAAQLNFEFSPADKSNSKDTNVVETQTVNELLRTVNNATYTIGSGAGCGAQGGPTGGKVSTPSASKKPISDLDALTGGKSPGTINTTILIGVVGGFLTILGIVGLALL